MVIPTRNRADMAITAVRYLLQQPGCELRVFVSDNSSGQDEVRKLADFCRELDHPLVTYMRPPEILGQGEHWDWAIREALRRSDATHVTVHYDRKVSKPGHARIAADVAARWPDKVLTYVSDYIAHYPPPLRVYQPLWTGKVYRVKTDRIIERSARGEAPEVASALPVLSNCFVPRAVVEALIEEFGDFCVSTTADSCFTYRFCALRDDFLHIDRSLTAIYGSHRSAGLGYLRGEGGDFADYRRTFRGQGWLDAAPIPGINLGYNMLFHEYELVRRTPAGKRRLPPLDRTGYLRDLGRGLIWVADPQQRAGMRRLLEEHGWDGEVPALNFDERITWRRRLYRRFRQSLAMFLADRLGIPPQTISGFAFRSDEEAVQYAIKYPQRIRRQSAFLRFVNAEEVGGTAA
jgi:hypothetical protein